MLTNLEYQSRAPLLAGSGKLQIKGDEIVNSDGIRSFSSRLYKKDNVIMGVRDIDNGRVYLKIIIKGNVDTP